MPVFQYKAINQDGQQSYGKIEAISQTIAVENLYSRGEVPLTVTEHSSSIWARLNQPVKLKPRISRKDTLRFTQELTRLLEAGIMVERALNILLETEHSKAMHGLIARILESVRDGKSLSGALIEEKKHFPLFYIQIIHAGEISGTLEDAFGRLTILLERQMAFRSSLISALIYPSILLVLIGVTLLVVVGVVLPEFEAVFAGAGADLPMPTQIVMTFGEILRNYGLFLLLGFVAAGAMFVRKLKQAKFRIKFDRWMIGQKWVGSLIVKGQLALTFRNLGSMIQNGVPVTDAFHLVTGTLSNKAIQSDLSKAFVGLKEGESLSQLFSSMLYFPKTALQLVRVGEETGNLGGLLGEAATILEHDVETTAKRFLTLFAPLMTLVMGALIAGIIGAVLLGIMSINDLAF